MLATNAQPDPIALFFNRLVQAIRSQDASSLQAMFQFHLRYPIHADIQRFIALLRTKPQTYLSEYADKATEKIANFKDHQGQPLDSQWCLLGGSYLQYLWSFNESDGNIQLDNFSKFFTLYTVVFVRSSGTWLVPLTKRLVQQGIALAHDTFVQLQRNRTYDSTYPFETPAKLLQRLLNSIMSDRLGTKTSIAYFIGNQLFRCYFKMNNHRMCRMVFDTLSKSPVDKSTLQKADRVTFEYYSGRYELHHLHFRNARQHLLYCLDNCHVQATKQRRLILIYLIAASLPLGLIPNPRLLQEFDLQGIFGPVIQALKEGSMELLTYALYDDKREWFRAMGIWLMLVERLETLIWRVFIRKIFLASYLPARAQNPNAHASISLHTIANISNIFLSRAAEFKNEDFLPWNADDLVAVCVNLIDQGYMKGYIAMERRILVLPKAEPFGFTKIADVRVNSRVTGIQILPDTEGRFEEI